MKTQTPSTLRRYSYIGSVNSSAKIKKGEKINLSTYVVYLAPHTSSGYQVCPKASTECIQGCLNTSGRVILDSANTILNARLNKTRDFFENRALFVEKVFSEIERERKKAERKGEKFSVRLNGTSDLSPELFKGRDGRNILETFPDIQFYDYTKVLNRSRLLERHSNYDLTFSFSGTNWAECEEAISKGLRVAVVFDTKKGQPLPATYKGIPVIDGDDTDYRPADDRGVIVGLRFKRIKDKKAMAEALQSSFVVKVN